MFETQKSVKVNGKFYVQISMKKKFKYLNSVFMNALTEIGQSTTLQAKNNKIHTHIYTWKKSNYTNDAHKIETRSLW